MAINYEQIRKANEAIRPTNISGKDYAEVNQRIKAFRMVFPEGFIQTDMVMCENGVCIFRASVGFFGADGKAVTLGSGTAYEKESSSFINKTSYIENCETSAVGRALGMCGFGIDTSVCSAEELQNAKLNQKDDKPKAVKAETKEEPKAEPKVEPKQEKKAEGYVPPATKDECVDALIGMGAHIDRVLVAYKYRTVADMPLEKLQEACRRKALTAKGVN